jgi:hypothetical protein
MTAQVIFPINRPLFSGITPPPKDDYILEQLLVLLPHNTRQQILEPTEIGGIL